MPEAAVSVVTQLVTVTIDGREVQVPKGMNLIEAAALAGIEIPYYCYHPHLSIAGNCRMCQVEVSGSPKLVIGCNTGAADGMVVKTHETSDQVAQAQRATLEFLLINHPLDCTVCDAAGHCKLQDYYYEYNSKGSRFIEEKVHNVKAQPLGPEIIYDGERCIMCTRCIRFCDEVTETSELGGFNRGDRSVIGIFPGKELDNELSGTVVDLCPVGALTHRRWRFNTRIWYTNETNSICTGCSTGCNAKVAVRDDKIVQVKARLNPDVNKEWMCDEGRYGFDRFQYAARITEPLRKQAGSFTPISWGTALNEAAKLKGGGSGAVFLAPTLTVEEMWLATRFATEVMGLDATGGDVAVQVKERPLTPVAAKLVSPDYAPNGLGFAFAAGLALGDDWRKVLAERYQRLLDRVRTGAVERLLIVGDYGILDEDVDDELRERLQHIPAGVALTPRSPGEHQHIRVRPDVRGHVAEAALKLLLPAKTVNEKAGLMLNTQGRLQRLRVLVSAPFGAITDWLILGRIAQAAGVPILPQDVVEERQLFREMMRYSPRLSGLSLMKIGEHGIPTDNSNALGGLRRP